MQAALLMVLACVLIVVAYELVTRLAIVADGHRFIALGRESFATISSANISDREKEQITRQLAVDVLKFLAVFVFKFSILVAVIGIVLFLFGLVAGDTFSVVLDHVMNPVFIVVTLILAVLYLRLRNGAG